MKLSIVSTLFNSAQYVNEFHARISLNAKRIAGDDYEIVFVNDGSPDSSLDFAIKLSQKDSHLKIIDLSRNFGHWSALRTGLEHAKGDRIFMIDSDLEEDPEWLLKFDELMINEQCDVVYGVQENRRGKGFVKITGKLFYVIFRKLTGVMQPDNMVTARLMTKRFVQALLSHRERVTFFGGLFFITGFKQSILKVNKHSTSPTDYDLSKKINLFVNSITSFSNLPLVLHFIQV